MSTLIMSSHLDEDSPVGPALSLDELDTVAALRRGDEAAFVKLVDRYHAALVRLALSYVPDRAAAEEVVQETWLGVLQGLYRFEGRSSLKTWIFRILVNCAKTRGVRERRTVPFSSLEDPEGTGDEPTVDPGRFRPSNHHWASAPQSWSELDDVLSSHVTLEFVEQVIAQLPPNQREVITLRDMQGWDAEEVCEVLGLSEGNQRVLLHRARAKVRRALAQYLGRD